MSSSSDEFEKLQKLLAVKRHEQPPGDFFHDFSSSVLGRINDPEPIEATTWWQRMGLDFDLKPAFVCAWGVAVCGALIIGIISSLNRQEPVSGTFVFVSPIELHPLRVGTPHQSDGIRRVDHWAAAPHSVLSPTMTPLSQFSVVAEPVGFNFGFRGY